LVLLYFFTYIDDARSNTNQVYSVYIFGIRKFFTPHVYENLQDRGMRKYETKT